MKAGRSDVPFLAGLGVLASIYGVLILAMLIADATFTSPGTIREALNDPAIRHSIRLSLLTCTLSAILSVWVAVPTAYVLSRCRFPGRRLLDALVDIPIILPPLVVGISLLILFQTIPGKAIESVLPITYHVPSIVLAQFTVACAFAIRTLRVTFDQIDVRREHVALTLGCNRRQAFFGVVLPEAWRGVIAGGTIAWARALGEFGPILVFSGATRMKTEVLPTTVFLELSVGDIEAALAVSLLMIGMAVFVLGLARLFGLRAGGFA